MDERIIHGVPELKARHSWFKFFPSDWQGDELLGMCAARGMLLELICIMHKATPPGHLLINGEQPTDAHLARLIRAGSVAEVRRLRTELLDRGVLSVTENGTVYSRRMVRKAAESHAGQINGRKGGNPVLKTGNNRKGYPDGLTPRVKTQKLETRNQRPESTARWKWISLYVSPRMHETIKCSLGKHAGDIDWDRVYEAAAVEYAERGQPVDLLRDLKVRAQQAAAAKRDLLSGPPSVEETNKRRAVEPELTPEQRRESIEALRQAFEASSAPRGR